MGDLRNNQGSLAATQLTGASGSPKPPSSSAKASVTTVAQCHIPSLAASKATSIDFPAHSTSGRFRTSLKMFAGGMVRGFSNPGRSHMRNRKDNKKYGDDGNSSESSSDEIKLVNDEDKSISETTTKDDSQDKVVNDQMSRIADQAENDQSKGVCDEKFSVRNSQADQIAVVSDSKSSETALLERNEKSTPKQTTTDRLIDGIKNEKQSEESILSNSPSKTPPGGKEDIRPAQSSASKNNVRDSSIEDSSVHLNKQCQVGDNNASNS